MLDFSTLSTYATSKLHDWTGT